MRRLGLLLLPEFSNLGLAAVTEPLFVANWLAQRTLFEWRSVSVDGKPVRASNGALLAVEGDLGGVKEQGSDAIRTLGNNSWKPARLSQWTAAG